MFTAYFNVCEVPVKTNKKIFAISECKKLFQICSLYNLY